MILIMKNYLFIFTISISFSQWFSLEHNGANRTYYVSSPESLNPGLVIDMHGYGMTADQEYQYTDMDYYAHQENLMVLYPQGLNNPWNVGTYWDSSSADDIEFISPPLYVDSGAKIANLHDPDGNIIELVDYFHFQKLEYCCFE